MSTLADALEQLRTGEVTARQLQRQHRDAHIRRAAHLIPACLPTVRAIRLAERVRAFQARRWPRWVAAGRVPEHADLIDVELFEARQFAEIPESKNQILEILNAEPSRLAADRSRACAWSKH